MSAGSHTARSRKWLTGVGVQAWICGGVGKVVRVDDGRSRWARFSRRALYSADLERSPRPKKEFISEIVLYSHAFSEEF
jgi:hypothetical protein